MNQQNGPLKGVRILVTRPREDAPSLCRAIEHSGGIPVHLPTIAIAPIAPSSLQEEKQRLNSADIHIFISRNAVRLGLRHYPYLLEPSTVTIAVGGGTANTFQDITKHQVTLIPKAGFDSEGVLALPELQQLSGKVFVIYKGEGGRSLLEQTLKDRGATVITRDLYRRTLPEISTTSILELLQQPIDIITTTSNEILENLIKIVPEPCLSHLKQQPTLVISPRGVEMAQKLGFTHKIIIASGADNQAILSALIQWKSS